VIAIVHGDWKIINGDKNQKLSRYDIPTLPTSEDAITGAPMTKPGLPSSMEARINTDIEKSESILRQSQLLLLILGL
jgi:hypothetical protein